MSSLNHFFSFGFSRPSLAKLISALFFTISQYKMFTSFFMIPCLMYLRNVRKSMTVTIRALQDPEIGYHVSISAVCTRNGQGPVIEVSAHFLGFDLIGSIARVSLCAAL